MKKILLVILGAFSMQLAADEAWRCVQDEKVVRIFLVSEQPDNPVPCEVRVERGGIIYRAMHDDLDLERCTQGAQTELDKYETDGYQCDKE